MGYLRPSAEFRDVYQYNGHMYTILSALPTQLLPSKPAFARYVKDNIFVPLGLNHTTYSFDVANSNGMLADGMARQNVNLTENPLGRGTVRPMPFWLNLGGEDGNGEISITQF